MSPIFPSFTRKEVLINWAKEQVLLFVFGLLLCVCMPGRDITIPVYLIAFLLSTALSASIIFLLPYKHFKLEHHERKENEEM